LWSSLFGKTKGSFTAAYFAAYMAVHLAYPNNEVRYMLPIFPLAFLYVWLGAKRLGEFCQKSPGLALRYGLLATLSILILGAIRMGPGKQSQLSVLFWGLVVMTGGVLYFSGKGIHLLRTAAHYLETDRRPLAIAVAGLVVGGLLLQGRLGRENLSGDPETYVQAPAAGAALWVRAGTPPDSVVMAERTGIVHRLSQRKAVEFPKTIKASFIEDVLRAHGVGYLVVSEPVRDPHYYPMEVERAAALMTARPGLLRQVHERPGAKVYQVIYREGVTGSMR